jgi:hypothetical protein
MMRFLHFSIVLILLAAAGGCTAPAPKKPNLTEGIKLRDLTPPDAKQRGFVLPPAINIETSIYAVPEAEYDRMVRVISAMMESGPGILRNGGDFRANGFAAGVGSINNLDRIKLALNEARARSINNNYVTVFDSKGNYLEVATVGAAMSVPYIRNGQQSDLILRPGVLAFRMVLRRPALRGSVSRLTLQPVWKPANEPSSVERASGQSRDIVFGNCGIETSIQAGDLVFVGPAVAGTQAQRLADVAMALPGSREAKIAIVMCTGMSQ